MNPKIIVPFKTRFPLKQSSPQSFDIEIQLGEGAAVLHPECIQELRLSDAEIDKAELAALRAVAIIEG